MSDKSDKRRPGSEHIPRYPRGWVTIRWLQLIISLVCIGLGAYSAAKQAWAGPLLTVWASVCTLIISIWLISAHTCAPRAFNYWACLILDIYLYIIWLGSMAACAVLATAIFAAKSTYNTNWNSIYGRGKSKGGSSSSSHSGSSSSSSNNSNSYDKTMGAITAAVAGLAAVQFLLFFICIITDAVVIHRHRKSGGHAKAIKANAILVNQPQIKPDYHAVPQQGMPYHQQDTSYNPQQTYNPYQPQTAGAPAPSYYAPQNPPPMANAPYYAPQTGVPHHTPTPPVPVPSPYAPPQMAQPAPTPYHPTY